MKTNQNFIWIFKFSEMHNHSEAVQSCTALPASATGSFTIRQHRGRSDASVVVTHCCTLMQMLHGQVVQLFCCIFFGKPFEEPVCSVWVLGFGEQMEIPASLPHFCNPPLYSICLHGLLTLWWPVRLLYWQLFLSLCPQKELTLKVGPGVEKTHSGLNKGRENCE